MVTDLGHAGASLEAADSKNGSRIVLSDGMVSEQAVSLVLCIQKALKWEVEESGALDTPCDLSSLTLQHCSKYREEA